jgi:hypothetical protein
MRRALAAGLAVYAVAPVRTARAGDPFEIQVYDGTADAPGVPGIELHVNEWATGHRESTPPELPLHGQLHATLEPSLGILPFWELGAYLQTSLRDAASFDWAGAKLRSKFVTPPGYSERWRLGVNVEVAYLPVAYDRDRWSGEVRPIVAWQDEHWLFACNPILDQALAGGGASDGPSFQPALKAWRSLGSFALGVEYYGTLGPVTAPLPARDQEHTLYGAFDLLSSPSFELNAAVGAGLTPASAGVVFKVILGYTFEAIWRTR